MTHYIRDAEDARYNGRNDWEKFDGVVPMQERVGGFVTTCERCGKEYEVRHGERTLNCNNATQWTPNHPEYDYLCSYCVDRANELGHVEMPEPRGWEDEVVRWVPTNTYHGPEARAEVLREDEPDCRGNLLCYLVGPEGVEEFDHGDRFVTTHPDAVELVE